MGTCWDATEPLEDPDPMAMWYVTFTVPEPGSELHAPPLVRAVALTSGDTRHVHSACTMRGGHIGQQRTSDVSDFVRLTWENTAV